NLRFDLSFDLTAPSSQPFLRLLRFVMSELDQANVAPMVRERLGDALLFQLLYSQPHTHSAHLDAPVDAAEPAQIRRVAEYLESRLWDEVRMSDLTRLTGTSARSIQAGFRKHRGCSPMDHLRAVRLDRARSLLSTADARAVSDIALACGFHHAGRFSTYYRARFGETPVETRARTR